MIRPTYDRWALGMAILTSHRSTCCRRMVGCVLVNERGHILSTGYNGVAAGLPHCNEMDPDGRFPHACPGAFAPSGTELDQCGAIHAEQNALLQCRDVYQIHTCYVTTEPCVTCAKLLLNTSCQFIVARDRYPLNGGRSIWRRAGRSWRWSPEETPMPKQR